VSRSIAKPFGNAPATGEGIETWALLTLSHRRDHVHDTPSGPAVAQICNKSDIVCDFSAWTLLQVGASSKVHTTYVRTSFLVNDVPTAPLIKASQWMEGKFKTPATRAPLLGGPNATSGNDPTVEPSTVKYGGDGYSTGEEVEWSGWGNTQAVATGYAWWVPSNKSDDQGFFALAKFVAFNLGTCNGRRAYVDLTWFFPGHGERLNKNWYLDVCDGIPHYSY